MYRFFPVANYPRPNSPGGSGEREGKGEKGRTIPSLGIYLFHLSIHLFIYIERKGKRNRLSEFKLTIR